MKIGICGGTFDPFHRGHLDPILHVRDEMQWDRVIYVPARMQPFKQDRETASGYHRFAMTAVATLNFDDVVASAIELERDEVSYTVDTLEALRVQFHGDTLDWIIGDDNLARLHEWKSIDRIFELANVTVLTRGDHSLPAAFASRRVNARERSTHGAVVFADNPAVAVSSTEIRRRVRDGESIGDLVPAPVSRYIHQYGLYRKGQS